MSVIYHGIDLAEIKQIARLLQRHGARFLNRVFTPAEQQYCNRHRRPAERFAARFAVKEAVMKMIGTGWTAGVAWTDIETVNNAAGKPEILLHGMVARRVEQMGVGSLAVSITHTGDLAIASVIAFSPEPPQPSTPLP